MSIELENIIRQLSKRGDLMPLYTVIKKEATKQGKSIYKIEHDLNIGNGTIGRWNKAIPRYDLLQAVADYLGVTPQYLLRLAKEDK